MKYLLAFLIFTFNNVSAQTKDMMIRISEIEIDSNYLKEYNDILQEESHNYYESGCHLHIQCIRKKIQHKFGF